jgi:hypothetical protein
MSLVIMPGDVMETTVISYSLWRPIPMAGNQTVSSSQFLLVFDTSRSNARRLWRQEHLQKNGWVTRLEKCVASSV